MKNTIYYAVAIFSLFLFSCAKERTFNCTETSTVDGYIYDWDYDANNNLIQIKERIYETSPANTQETKYAKIAKKKGNELCPLSYTYVENVVDTFMYKNLIVGDMYNITRKTECSLE